MHASVSTKGGASRAWRRTRRTCLQRARLEEAAGDVVQGRQIRRAHHGGRGGYCGRRSLGRRHRRQGQRGSRGDSRSGPRARTRARACPRPRARPRALLRARTRARPRCGAACASACDPACVNAHERRAGPHARTPAISLRGPHARSHAVRMRDRSAPRGGSPRDSLTRCDSLCVSHLPTSSDISLQMKALKLSCCAGVLDSCASKPVRRPTRRNGSAVPTQADCLNQDDC